MGSGHMGRNWLESCAAFERSVCIIDESGVPETHKQSRLTFVKTFDIFLIIEKKGNGVSRVMTQSHYTHKTKAKATELRFYCCSSSYSEVFNTEQTFTSQRVQDGPWLRFKRNSLLDVDHTTSQSHISPQAQSYAHRNHDYMLQLYAFQMACFGVHSCSKHLLAHT